MELAQRYFAARAARDILKDQLEQVQAELDAAEQALVLFMENNTLQNFKDENHGMVYLREQVYARIENPDLAFDWLRANNLQDVIKPTVHSKTLSAIVKEHLEKGETELPGIASSMVTKIGFRKGA